MQSKEGRFNTKLLCTVTVIVLGAIVPAVVYHCLSSRSDSDSPRYKQILSSFLASQPTAMNVSPDGKFLLTKSEQDGGFKLSVIDLHTKTEVSSAFSKNSPLELTWQPNSKAVVFQEISGLDRPLYMLDVPSAKKTQLKAPISQSALPPLRWNPAGTRLAYYDGDYRTGRLLVVNLQDESLVQVVADKISVDCDFVWSPDGSHLAWVSKSKSDLGVLTVATVNNLRRIQFRVADGEIRKLAWSPDGATILATARGAKDEFFKLFEVDIHTEKTSVKQEAWGDITEPRWTPDGRSFLYHVYSNGITRAFVCGTRSPDAARLVGPTNGVLNITHIDQESKIAYAHFSSMTTPPVLGQISIQSGDWTLLYGCPNEEKCRCPEPEFITVKSRDGTAVPAYHWRATPQAGTKPSALIVVHGGLHTQTFPTWEGYIREMTAMGCEVIAVNHRGSTGLGLHYEELKGDPVLDIVAARDYAANDLKVESSRIFLTGISTGSRLIAIAAAYGSEIGGLILVSWPGDRTDFDKRFAGSFPVLEFHGDLDAVLSPEAARQSIKAFFNGDERLRFQIQFRDFKDEGHFFYRSDSKAAIYSALSKLIQPAQ